ncbi:MAG TPA: phosphatase PAP2 family protein [Gemmatirosa sp.]
MTVSPAPLTAARRPSVAAGVTAAVALAAVAALGADVYDRPPGPFDARTETWALAHRTRTVLVAFEWITRIGEPAVVFMFAVLVAVWLWWTGARRGAAMLVAAPASAILVFNLIKQLVHRARPAGGLLLRAATYSFPSGHAAVSAAAFGTLGLVLAREGRLSRPIAGLLAVGCPLVIGLSRIYLGAHWATDVLAGWCLGAAIAAIAAGAYQRVTNTPR